MVFFRGPWYTYQAYLTNKEGGIDVTKDIMANISMDDYHSEEVVIEKIHTIFGNLAREEKKGLIKALKRTDLNIVPIKRVYAGRYVNIEEGYEPPIFIGIELLNDNSIDVDHVLKNLKRYFFKHVQFDIIDLKESELAGSLIEQGELIYGNPIS